MLCSSSRTALLTCTIRLTCRLPDLSERSIRAALAVDSADLNEVASRLLSGGDAAATPVPVLAMMSREPLPPASLAGASLSAGASGERAASADGISTEATDREVALAAAREEVAALPCFIPNPNPNSDPNPNPNPNPNPKGMASRGAIRCA